MSAPRSIDPYWPTIPYVKSSGLGPLPRVFVALPLTTDQSREVSAFLTPWIRKPAAKGIRWVAPTKWHITLVFVGPITDAQAVDLCDCVREAAASIAPFRWSLAGTGVFPHAKNPRVLWLGMDDPPGHAKRLVLALRDHIEAFGLPFDARPFQPHLTVARIQSVGRSAGENLASFTENQDWRGREVEANHVEVLSSNLTRQRAEYAVLARASLSIQPDERPGGSPTK